jgi:hypothetical protein
VKRKILKRRDQRYGKPQKKRIKQKHKTQWKATAAD